MAGGSTRNAPPTDKIDELVQQLTQFQNLFSTTKAEVSQRVELLERRSPENRSSPETNSSQSTLSQPPRLKLDVPRFNGTNAHGWIFKISRFFSYHQTPEEERITVASFYLDGAALAWY